MRTIITTGTMLTPDQALKDHTLIIERGRIAAITDQAVPELPGDKHLDLRSYTVVPGFIDIHVHGADGADTMDATAASLHRMGRYFARYGITGFLPTTMAASAMEIEAAIQNLSALSDHDDSARPLGIQLEGPYLNQTYRNAQPAQDLRAADPREYNAWLAYTEVRLVTVAPEPDGVSELVIAGVQVGIEFAVGHSSAPYEQIPSAADFGLRQATHVFNGMAGPHHRMPGVLGAILSDDHIRAQIIADGAQGHDLIWAP